MIETVFTYASKFDNKGARFCGNTWIDSIADKSDMFSDNKITMKIDTEYCFCGVGKELSTTATTTKTCANCLSGKWQSQIGFNGTCTSCIRGKFATTSASITATDCQKCPIGMSQATKGQPFCENCQAGRIQTEEGQAECFDCSKGQYRPRQIEINKVMTNTNLTKCK